MNYAAAVWTPQLSNSHWTNLQLCQNVPLRTATGCVQITDVDHLHREANILQVKGHSEMFSQQYLLAYHKPDHTGNGIVMQPPPPRNIRRSVLKHQQDIAWLNPHPTLEKDQYRSGTQKIHERPTHMAINSLKLNIVLSG